jgi:hypothetical protein
MKAAAGRRADVGRVTSSLNAPVAIVLMSLRRFTMCSQSAIRL